MPRACPAEFHACCYTTAIPIHTLRCRGLAPRSFTFAGDQMRMQPYTLDELKFAYQYRVYVRFHTHCRRPIPALQQIATPPLNELLEPYHVHVLESAASPIDLRTLLSLRPTDSVSIAVSKLKGRVSKWLTEHAKEGQAQRHLGHGYFACTTGDSSRAMVSRYLDQQGKHHGYTADSYAHPPVLVLHGKIDEGRLRADHAATVLQFHVVLATEGRRGVFHTEAAERVAQMWMDVVGSQRAALVKASFLPDHVHLALQLHPAAVSTQVVIELMNRAQELMMTDFEAEIVRAGVRRLWQPSAYVGSYGDLETPKIRRYIERFERDAGNES